MRLLLLLPLFVLSPDPLQSTPEDHFVLADVLHVHRKEETISKELGTSSKAFSYFAIPAGAPANWKTPVDFASGTLRLKIEVVTKPSRRPVHYQMCVWQNGEHACSGQKAFTEPGVYEAQESLSSFWNGGKIDWSKPLAKIMLVVKDRNGNPVDDRFGFGGKWDGSPDFSHYYPMIVRFTAVLVAKGAAYNPNALTARIEGLHYRDLIELRSLAPSWANGQLGAVLAGAARDLETDKPARAAEARRVVDALTAYAERKRGELEAVRAEAPEYAATALGRLGQLFGTTALGKDLSAQAKEWQKAARAGRAKRP